jgi:dTDP-4-dehydrorhamnose reductase
MTKKQKIKILILGTSGGLGSMLFSYFSQFDNYELRGSIRNKKFFAKKVNRTRLYFFDVENDDIFQKIFSKFKPDYIVNCIGILNKPRPDGDKIKIHQSIIINSIFPYKLAQAARKIESKIIQITTDCVYSGNKGRYTENDFHDALDVYGKTKSLGEIHNDNFLNIRCSFIGPELEKKINLLEWFLNHSPGTKINGFSHHKWNGITSLQFAQLCRRIIEKGEKFFKKLIKTSSVHHYLPNKSVSKYELLKIFNEVFKKDFKIKKVNNVGKPINRTLATQYRLLEDKSGPIPMKRAIQELKNYMDKIDYYQAF